MVLSLVENEIINFNNTMPFKKSLFGKKYINTSKLNSSSLLEFAKSGALLKLDQVTENCGDFYNDVLKTLSLLPPEFQLHNILEKEIELSTSSNKTTRQILTDRQLTINKSVKENFSKMIFYYLMADNSDIIKQFSKICMNLTAKGFNIDYGQEIMRAGHLLTQKLEELSKNKLKNKKLWNALKNPVIHCFNCAEAIGNRNVNRTEHLAWEDRLVRLGLIEKKLELEDNLKHKQTNSISQTAPEKSGPSAIGVSLSATPPSIIPKQHNRLSATKECTTKNKTQELVRR